MTKDTMPKLGQRSTRQRAAVVEVLRDIDTFSSAKMIHHELVERKYKVGLTTVYRTLQSLVDINAVDVLHMANGESLYRRCESSEHHHHLVCTNCGNTVEISGKVVETWADNTAKEHNFQISGHTAEIFGLCSNCHE
ncbi:Fur family transcriptional regulator [Corynebacterium epidermidicanis]|uniref:Fe2+/Zn2+ uptake regulation protein n=1 Tax=Corynebacterium epidermidicanis TaxID=1050174 RepID=A0A0G3GXU4_9CORY|nr:Fur family transcriptional regulator [Corynebacterium epidermidicanis]AKK03627.1 Fe2+/Zn2+ uptake regulation protein [Corynebacterium epidermidicanis]